MRRRRLAIFPCAWDDRRSVANSLATLRESGYDEKLLRSKVAVILSYFYKIKL